MNFENMLSNKHNQKRPSMILIHSYEMSKTGKSEIESKLDFSDSGKTPLNCIFHWVYFMVYEIYLQKRDISQQNCKNKKKLYQFWTQIFFLVIQCETKVIKVNIEQLLFALNPKVEIIMRDKRKYQNQKIETIFNEEEIRASR